jgi:ABC-2 type transport system permease protein
MSAVVGPTSAPAIKRQNAPSFNRYGLSAIYRFEMARFRRTIVQSVVTPVITTSLYFVVFGSAIGSRMVSIDGVSYGAFIVPGLVMLTVLTESLNNSSFGIYMPKFAGTIYEMLSAPVSFVEVLAGYVGAAATKSVMLGSLILVTARLFVPFEVQHPIAMLGFLILTSVTFSLLGFAIGIWADSWEKTSIVPTMIVTPLTFLGGSFYSLSMLPPVWQKLTLFNPVVYLINGFRWSFYGKSDVSVGVSLGMTVVFLLICIAIVGWIFRTGYRLRN